MGQIDYFDKKLEKIEHFACQIDGIGIDGDN